MKLKNYCIAIFLTMALFACEVKRTETGETPDIEVKTEPGKLPKYEVNWTKVNIGTRTKTIKVPKVMVVMEEREVEVPYLDLNMPDSNEELEERVIKVEAEVSDYMHELDIKKIYAVDNRLIVISELEKEDEPLEGRTVRVSDQIILNAPEDLRVRHYIIGDRPERAFNTNYKYVASEAGIDDLADARLIYED